MKNKHSKHEWKSNTLPSIVMVGPVTLLLLFLVVAPLIFVAVMSFCQTDQYYNVSVFRGKLYKIIECGLCKNLRTVDDHSSSDNDSVYIDRLSFFLYYCEDKK